MPTYIEKKSKLPDEFRRELMEGLKDPRYLDDLMRINKNVPITIYGVYSRGVLYAGTLIEELGLRSPESIMVDTFYETMESTHSKADHLGVYGFFCHEFDQRLVLVVDETLDIPFNYRMARSAKRFQEKEGVANSGFRLLTPERTKVLTLSDIFRQTVIESLKEDKLTLNLDGGELYIKLGDMGKNVVDFTKANSYRLGDRNCIVDSGNQFVDDAFPMGIVVASMLKGRETTYCQLRKPEDVDSKRNYLEERKIIAVGAFPKDVLEELYRRREEFTLGDIDIIKI